MRRKKRKKRIPPPLSDGTLRAANIFLWQWLFVRLTRVISPETMEQTGWAFRGPVLPLTGWGKTPAIGKHSALYMWPLRHV